MKFKNNELKDSNWRTRKDELVKLAQSGTQDSIATLIQALQDVNDEVAQMAAESLINIGLPVVQPLIETLLNGEWPLSDLAGETLVRLSR